MLLANIPLSDGLSIILTNLSSTFINTGDLCEYHGFDFAFLILHMISSVDDPGI